MDPVGPAGKPRIAIVCPDLTVTGGLRSVAEFVYRAVERSGLYEPMLISLATAADDRASVRLRHPSSWVGGPRTQLQEVAGVRFQHVGAYWSELEWMRYAPRQVLTRLMRECALVHVVAGSPAWGNAAMRSGRPVCLEAATLARWERGRPQGGPAVRGWRSLMTVGTSRLDRRAIARADHVLAMNDQLLRYCRRRVDGRASLFHPGTDLDHFQPPPAYRANGHLLAVGRLGEPRKDWNLLLRAYVHAVSQAKSLPDLVIAGRGTLLETDAALLAHPVIAGRVRIAHDPTPRKLLELYQEASLYVLSSREEGFGLVVVEAMACALPVVATRLAGTTETVAEGETGRLVDRRVDTAATMGDVLAELWGRPDLRESMGLHGRRRAQLFSSQRSAEVLMEVYQRLLAEPRA